MRILPLIFFIKDKPIYERFRYINDISSLTHRHIRSVIACFIYSEYALLLLQDIDKMEAFRLMQQSVNQFLKEESFCSEYEINKFRRLLENPVNDYETIPIHQFPVILPVMCCIHWRHLFGAS